MLCVTVAATTTAELRCRRDEVADADLVELRLDYVRDPDVAGALGGRRRPVVVTCRPRWEGGRFGGSEEERRRVLEEALARGAEFVDIESRAGFHDLIGRTGGRRLVLSSHDFERVPDDAVERLRAMRATGAEVVKLAARVTCLRDCERLREIGQSVRDGQTVLVGLGECGIVTRVLPSLFGSSWTYAGSLDDVGQLSATTILDDYRFRTIGESTALYGLVGKPIAQSVSPAMHNAAFDAAGQNAVYLPLAASDADDFVHFARAFGLRGASVTVPYKVAFARVVDEMEPAASRIGAVNTISVDQDRWIGDNTDGIGFLDPLRSVTPLPSLSVAILGAGGAARAVADALVSAGARVTLHARNRAQAETVAEAAGARVGDWPAPAGTWDLLVNCTSVGMHPAVEETPIPADHLTGRYVYDLVYNPRTTRLLREAARKGCETIGGLEMLVAQAHEQFRRWTGVRPAAGVMRAAAVKRLAEFTRDEHHVV